MRDPFYVLIIGIGLFMLTLVGLLVWSELDFANRCERAGGVNINSEICVPAGTQILMVSD